MGHSQTGLRPFPGPQKRRALGSVPSICQRNPQCSTKDKQGNTPGPTFHLLFHPHEAPRVFFLQKNRNSQTHWLSGEARFFLKQRRGTAKPNHWPTLVLGEGRHPEDHGAVLCSADLLQRHGARAAVHPLPGHLLGLEARELLALHGRASDSFGGAGARRVSDLFCFPQLKAMWGQDRSR